MAFLGTATATAAALTLLFTPAAFAEEETKTEKQEMKTDSQSEATKPEEMKKEKKTDRSRGRSELADSSAPAGNMNVVKASDLIGYTVTNPQGDTLGQIQDLVIDPEQGRIAYAVMSFGGFLGVGDKLFALPWETLSLKANEQTLLLAVDKEKLQKAPGFDKNNWPNMASREWGTSVHQYYNQKPYWENSSAMKAPENPSQSTTSRPSMGVSESMGEPSQRPGEEGTEASPMAK